MLRRDQPGGNRVLHMFAVLEIAHDKRIVLLAVVPLLASPCFAQSMPTQALPTARF
jgi:hypothetical protein